MTFIIDSFLDALRMKEVDNDRYEAPNIDTGTFVVFGGQLLAQSIAAASLGNDGKAVKTLHTVFARAASPDKPVEITVDRMHSGRALSSSTVTISQGDRLCTRSIVLLSADEPDFIRHACEPPSSTTPPSFDVSRNGDWDVHIADGADIRDPDAVGPPQLDVWSRFHSAPDDRMIAQALLAFATDGYLIGTAMRPHHGVGQDLAHKSISTGVLSHTLTFHESFSAADWLLLAHSSPHAGHGRSYGRADVFQEDGNLVASYVQDNMIRPMRTGSSL